jgi:ATP-dependent DNA helicase RecG
LNSKKVGTPIQFIGVFVLLLTISTILAEDIHSNCGGPDRSIQLQSFQAGQVRPSRYRNRRLGDFLKELDLTEGKATGIPTVFKELKKNGSPEPRFNTDDDRTFFEVELYIHPDFKSKQLLQ